MRIKIKWTGKIFTEYQFQDRSGNYIQRPNYTTDHTEILIFNILFIQIIFSREFAIQYRWLKAVNKARGVK